MSGEKKLKIILASSSPRRKELLSFLGLKFEVIGSKIDEIVDPKLSPNEVAVSLASQKAKDVFENTKELEKKLVIGSDTIVVYNQKIYGKPKDRNDAFNILKELNGKTHDVYTGVSLHMEKKIIDFFEKTKVTFQNLTDTEINWYLSTHESFDKAGAYGIQGFGLSFIEKIEGSYSNVVGFPISSLKNQLISIAKGADNWRDSFY